MHRAAGPPHGLPLVACPSSLSFMALLSQPSPCGLPLFSLLHGSPLTAFPLWPSPRLSPSWLTIPPRLPPHGLPLMALPSQLRVPQGSKHHVLPTSGSARRQDVRLSVCPSAEGGLSAHSPVTFSSCAIGSSEKWGDGPAAQVPCPS